MTSPKLALFGNDAATFPEGVNDTLGKLFNNRSNEVYNIDGSDMIINDANQLNKMIKGGSNNSRSNNSNQELSIINQSSAFAFGNYPLSGDLVSEFER